jgi:hypothetical protein
MIRWLVIAALAMTCASCAGASGSAATSPDAPLMKNRSYQLDPGAADYDSLRRATELCKTRNGTLVPRKDADLTELSDYSCVIDKRS